MSNKKKKNDNIAETFRKMARRKRQLLGILRKNVPLNYSCYIEPFVGGGALLFDLFPMNCIISDINSELVNAYIVIKDNIKELIESLKKHKNEEEYYYKIRSLSPDSLSPIERASRFIYLNKTCFNGLYRENSKGGFNAAFGKYDNPNIVDEENLLAVSFFLNSRNIEILNQDYTLTCQKAKKKDFVYMDPPYYPSKKTSFTKYNKNKFLENEQLKLFDVFSELDKKGCYVMMSNSNTPFILDLYKDYNILKIEANRSINVDIKGRKKQEVEVIIKNY